MYISRKSVFVFLRGLRNLRRMHLGQPTSIYVYACGCVCVCVWTVECSFRVIKHSVALIYFLLCDFFHLLPLHPINTELIGIDTLTHRPMHNVRIWCIWWNMYPSQVPLSFHSHSREKVPCIFWLTKLIIKKKERKKKPNENRNRTPTEFLGKMIPELWMHAIVCAWLCVSESEIVRVFYRANGFNWVNGAKWWNVHWFHISKIKKINKQTITAEKKSNVTAVWLN